MNNNPKTCLDALSHIPCSECSYQEWVNVGMALQGEGFDCSVWDAWSRTDPDRYKPGECERKWKTFHGAGTPVTGGTIVQMAKQRGYDPRSSLVMGWDDEIFDDGDDFNEHSAPDEFNPCEQLKTYLLTLFKPDELVSFVTNDVWQDKKKNGSRGFRCFPSSLSFLQIHHIMRARFDTSTMWVRSGYASGAISRIQDNTGCRCFASVHLVSIRYLFGVLLVYNRCSSGVRLVCSRCDGVLQSRKKHDPQDSESRRSQFYVYSISWVNTDMQLTSY